MSYGPRPRDQSRVGVVNLHPFYRLYVTRPQFWSPFLSPGDWEPGHEVGDMARRRVWWTLSLSWVLVCRKSVPGIQVLNDRVNSVYSTVVTFLISTSMVYVHSVSHITNHVSENNFTQMIISINVSIISTPERIELTGWGWGLIKFLDTWRKWT